MSCYHCHSKTKYRPCRGCKAVSCPNHLFQYVDENNRAITKAQSELCLFCYSDKFPKDAPNKQLRLFTEYNILRLMPIYFLI